MALEVNVTKDHHVFIGEDKVLEFVIYTDHTKTVVLDTSAMSLIWVLRTTDKSAVALITKSTDHSPPGITHDGTFNADPDVNTQKVQVHLYDTDSYDDTGSPVVTLKKRKYRHALKRMDDGSETVLAFGNFQFLQATTR